MKTQTQQRLEHVSKPKGVASFTQIRTNVLEKLVRLFKRFSVKLKAICNVVSFVVSLLFRIVFTRIIQQFE